MTKRQQLKIELCKLVSRKVELTQERRTRKKQQPDRPRGEEAEALVPHPWYTWANAKPPTITADLAWQLGHMMWCVRQDQTRDEVRAEIRYVHLAYAALRGRPYKQQEPKTKEGNNPNPYVVQGVLENIGVSVYVEAIKQWFQGASLEIPRDEPKVEAAE